jgi:hypothetical protein
LFQVYSKTGKWWDGKTWLTTQEALASGKNMSESIDCKTMDTAVRTSKGNEDLSIRRAR